MSDVSYILSCDIGGTFTDTVLIDSLGNVSYSKASTTPDNIVNGILDSLKEIALTNNLSLDEILDNCDIFSNGTTVGTNAIIERKVVKTGFIVTKGFKDLIVVMKGDRGWGLSEEAKLHYSKVEKQIPLVPLSLTEEINERIDYKGNVIVPLDEKGVRDSVRSLIKKGVEAIAVTTLWSCKNPKHEKRIKKIIKEIDKKIFSTISSELIPMRGEYERAVTTIINCLVSPILQKYIIELKRELKRRGFKKNVLIMQSNGGLTPEDMCIKTGVKTILSGPVGGIIASQYLSEIMNERNVITTDMGGTSFDVGLIIDGKPIIQTQSFLPESNIYATRYRVLTPMIEIQSIGSGGGSIAWMDENIMNVGPQSAGADPGPACYDKGGTKPTVTDANVVLGYINPDYFLGGKFKLNRQKSVDAIKNKIAEHSNLSVVRAAAGIIDIVNNNMADLIRKATIERGFDPRDCVLFAYGGAGPMHCCAYGAELGVKSIIIPSGLATAYSALGIGLTDLRYSGILSDRMIDINLDRVNRNFKKLEDKGFNILNKKWGIPSGNISHSRSLDIRYRLQTHEISTPVHGGKISQKILDNIIDEFKKLYEMLYGSGSAPEKIEIEFVNFKVDTIGRIERPLIKKYPKKKSDPSRVLKERRKAYFHGKFQEVNIYEGEKLNPGNRISGPAIVEYLATTAVIHPRQEAIVDEYLNLIIKL